MAVGAVVRVITYILVAFQSYFKYPTDIITDPTYNSNTDQFQLSKHHLAGIILARGGSKGIPKKNLAPLNGKPLIHWALEAMIESGVFRSVWVSTDDEAIANFVNKQFPPVHIHRRAAYTATDTASSLIAVQEFLSLHPEVDAIGLVQATSPFVQPEYLRQASALLETSDSVFSVSHSSSLRWKPQDAQGFTEPLNFNPKQRPRRQDWAGEMVENGMFYFTMRDIIVNENAFQSSKRSRYVVIPKFHSLEIDTPEDLSIAQLLMQSHSHHSLVSDHTKHTQPTKTHQKEL